MLISNLFGKEIGELTVADLEAFFSVEQLESDKIEFKSTKENFDGIDTPKKEGETIKKIMQTICGFLNTDGGIIIWGTPEGKYIGGNSKEKTYIGELTIVKTRIEKDQFLNKVSDQINPTAARIRFVSLTHKGGWIYIFEVLKSEYSPHQLNGTYFLRLDGQTRPAPHQYVEALMKKARVAKLEMEFSFLPVLRAGNFACLPFTITSQNVTKYINDKDIRLDLSSHATIIEPNEIFAGADNETHKVISVANILYPGLPVKHDFILVTPMYYGWGRRNIPITALLTGENSPVSRSNYNFEFFFQEDGSIKTELVYKSENVNLQDLDMQSIWENDRDIKLIRERHFQDKNLELLKSIREWAKK